MNSEIANIKVLQKALSAGLLNDIEDLLDKQAKKDRLFNILRVFGIEELEIRHSFMLKWLLSPTENHGLGVSFLKLFLMAVINENDAKHPGRYKVLQNLRAADYETFTVYREMANIDLLLVSEKKKIVLAVENKWSAKERVDTEDKEGQLSKYEKWVSKSFSGDWKRYFVFLTLDKRLPSEPNADKWDVLGYDSIAKILKRLLGEQRIALKKSSKFQRQHMLLEHYYRIVERKLSMEGEELSKMCTQIYDRHRDALDLLFEKANRREPLLRRLEEVWIDEKGGAALRSEGKSTSYVQYKRRFPLGADKSVHYEVRAQKTKCIVALHVEKDTDQAVKDNLLAAVASQCEMNGDMTPSKPTTDILGGAEIVIRRRGRPDADVETEIRQGIKFMYKVFEPILQGFKKKYNK